MVVMGLLGWATWQQSHGHQVGDMEHGSLMQGHIVGALVEMSLMDIQ